MTDQMISDFHMLCTILDQLCINETPVLIGQNDHIIWGTIKDVNSFSKRLAIRPIDLNIGFAIDPNLPVLIRSENENIYFETKATNFSKRNLSIFRFPQDILIREARQGSRFYFNEENLLVYCSNYTLVDYSLSSLNWSAQLHDISESGIAIVSDDPLAAQFKKGDTIIFTFINNYSLPEKLTGEIVYIQQKENYKIGIKFERIIPIYDVLDNLKARQ